MQTNKTKQFKRDLKKFKPNWYDAQFQKLIPTSNGQYRLKFLVWNPSANDGQGDTESYATYNKYSLKNIERDFFGGKTAEEMKNTQYSIHLVKNPHNDLMTISGFKKHKWVYSEKWIAHHEQWQGCKNGEAPSEIKEQYLEERRKTDPKFKRTEELRKLGLMAVRGEIADGTMVKVFGIDHKGLIKHLKSTIRDRSIKWENRKSWHLDHIIPLTDFNVLDKEEAKKAIHYKNLQVITPEQNLKKYSNTATTTPQLSVIEMIFGE